MTNELQLFNFEGTEVKVLEIEGNPYFIGNEIAQLLGYSNYRKAVMSKVDEEDKLRSQIGYAGQNREVTLINESGMYSLVLSSKLESAKQFKRWVTSEVLPSIRQNGAYMTENTLEKAITDPDFMIGLLTKLKESQNKQKELEEQKKQLTLENIQQKQLIGELKPKADYTDIILKSTKLLTITQIAKDYGMSGQAMNEKLHDLGVQYKQSGQWLLYSKYHNKAYTNSSSHNYIDNNGNPQTKLNTKWTQKGRLFLYTLLKSKGIIPTIEKEAI